LSAGVFGRMSEKRRETGSMGDLFFTAQRENR
jgi:hypothetical protein